MAQAEAMLSRTVRELCLGCPSNDLRIDCARYSRAFHQARKASLVAIDALTAHE